MTATLRPLPRDRAATLPWHVLLEPDGGSGAEQMARDQALLGAAARTGHAFLRLYRFAPPCLSLGRNEPALLRYDRTAIERSGIDVVRRPTGGRAVWHEHDLTYAVAAPIAAFGSLRQSYCRIHERLVQALRALGVAAALAPARHPTPALGVGACFASPAGGEVLVGGRKLVGSAQVRRDGAFLQHGSVLLDGSQEVVAMLSRAGKAARGDTSVAAVLGRPVSFAEMARAIIETWFAAPGAPLRVAAAPAAPFRDPAWTWRR